MTGRPREKAIDLSNQVGALVVERLVAKDVAASEAIAVLLSNLSALIAALPEANRVVALKTALDDLPGRVQECVEEPVFTFTFPQSQPKD